MFQPERVTLQNPSSWTTGKLTSLLTLLLFLAGVSPRLAAQASEWTWMGGSNTTGQPGVYGTKGVPAAGNVPGARGGAVSWTDGSGNLWLFGGQGNDGVGGGGDLNDLWMYTPSTGEWTWMSGSNAAYQFSSYGTPGVPAPGNMPGCRSIAVSWTDSSSNLWLFGGFTLNPVYPYVGGIFNDLWMYAPSTGEWTWMSGGNTWDQNGVYGTMGVPAAGNVPGGREVPVTWTDSNGDLWLFGGQGYVGNDREGALNDVWRYAPSTSEWTWMGGSNAVDQPGNYGTPGVPAAGNLPGARLAAVSWMDASGNVWLFGGEGVDADGSYGALNDLWKYTPSTGEWTWMGGSNTADQPGVYGTLGVPAAGNVPGGRDSAVGWTDSGGNFWLFGGNGCYVGGYCSLNDLWKYNPSTSEWTWMGGSNTPGQPGVYGTKGVPAAGDVPGARGGAVSWTDGSGNLWLFGGSLDVPGGGSKGDNNDLWKYTPAPTPPPSTPSLTTPAPGSTLSGSTATFAWSNPGNRATRFVLRLGTAYFGTMDVYSPSPTTGTTAQVSAIPTNGAYLYARLWYYVNGKWQFVDALYTEAGTPTPPAFTTPAPGSTLPGSTVTFGWNPGDVATRFVLRLGTTGLGSSDVYSGAATKGTSVQLTTVPTNGAKLYARLWYYLNETWKYVDATYTETGK
jgi:N-acetylneuraminic acid mutarotase